MRMVEMREEGEWKEGGKGKRRSGNKENKE